jgi:hypothetical protein
VIEIEGGTQGYSVDISDPTRPEFTTRPPAPYTEQPVSTANLGHWAQAGVVDLEGNGSPGEFQLVIARVSRNIGGGIEHYTFTKLIHRDPSPGMAWIFDSLKLFEGIFLETVD